MKKETIKINNLHFKDIAQIHSGVRNTQFKNKEEKYEYKIITLNNENNFQINKEHLEQLKTDKQLNQKYLLKKGNIIMRLTPPYTARIVEFDIDNLTTTSNYAIIKVNEKYSPEILNFYLNSEYTKKQIYKFSEQTSIKVINITHIKNFEIKDINRNIDSYTTLIRTYEEKKKLVEQQLQLEENLIEEIIFGE